jgi:hypothetical protein
VANFQIFNFQFCGYNIRDTPDGRLFPPPNIA